MRLTMRAVRPDDDATLLHSWVSQPRAGFWGMTDLSRVEVRDLYAFLDSLTTHHAHLVHADGRPVAIFQTYEPQHDPVGEAYDVQPGDLGMHLFVAEAPRVEGFTGCLYAYVVDAMFEDPSVQRIVGEPDVDNAKSLTRALRTGAEAGPVIELEHKRAQLMFMTRDSWEALASTRR